MNAKPTVGSAPPWAGVTPALGSEKTRKSAQRIFSRLRDQRDGARAATFYWPAVPTARVTPALSIKRRKPFILNAGGGTRTRTELSLQRILSPI